MDGSEKHTKYFKKHINYMHVTILLNSGYLPQNKNSEINENP